MRSAFMVETGGAGAPVVFVAVTHDNRFIGVFGSEQEAQAAAGLVRRAYVSREPLSLPLAGEDRNR